MASAAWALVRDLRVRTRLSQRQLASAAGVTPATIARIEKGRMEPTVALLTKIVAAAGLELELKLREPDPDERKARQAMLALTPEERLKQNDRLSVLWVTGRARA